MVGSEESKKKEQNLEGVCPDEGGIIMKCGLVMPISPIDGCSSSHWEDVHQILSSAIESVGFSCAIVSDADEVGVIQDRIVTNVYYSDIVVCDVSCKNPNVMFELGMRLAFDKAVVIVKDDMTDYTFDTSILEHLEYPRDLRHPSVELFKKKLADKVVSTHKASCEKDYSAFLKHFGRFNVAKIGERDVKIEELVTELYSGFQLQIQKLSKSVYNIDKKLNNINDNSVKSMANYLNKSLELCDDEESQKKYRLSGLKMWIDPK